MFFFFKFERQISVRYHDTRARVIRELGKKSMIDRAQIISLSNERIESFLVEITHLLISNEELLYNEEQKRITAKGYVVLKPLASY